MAQQAQETLQSYGDSEKQSLTAYQGTFVAEKFVFQHIDARGRRFRIQCYPIQVFPLLENKQTVEGLKTITDG